ncbi:MAG: hypothetical protein ABI431_07075, partial [Candidatus Tumulicola sp.]
LVTAIPVCAKGQPTVRDDSISWRYICSGTGVTVVEPASQRFRLNALSTGRQSLAATFIVGTYVFHSVEHPASELLQDVAGLAYSLDGSPITTLQPSPEVREYKITIGLHGLSPGTHKLWVIAIPTKSRSAYKIQTIGGVAVADYPITYCFRITKSQH